MTIGLDLGTTSAKGCVVSEDGRIVVASSRDLPLESPWPGWFEFGPIDYRDAVIGLVAELAHAVPNRVAAISVAAASGDTLLLGERNQPLGKFISWMDRRASDGTASPESAGHSSEEIYSVVGWPYLGSMTLAHLLWMRQYEPEVMSRTCRVAMNNDFIGFHLCGQWAIDHSTATTSYLQHQVERVWHQPYLELVGIDRSMLSDLGETGTSIAAVLPEVAAACELATDAIVVRGCFDHPAGARACAIGPNDVLLSLGTSWVALTQVRDREQAIGDGFLVDPAGPEAWYGMSSIPSVGRTLDALVASRYPPRRSDGRYDRFTQAVANEPPAQPGDLPTVAEFGSDGSGALREAAARGVVEVLALEIRKRVEALAPNPDRIVVIGGPSTNDAILQVVTDVLGRPVLAGPAAMAGALGAAGIAMVSALGAASGWFARLAAGMTATEPDRDMANHYDDCFQEYVNGNP